MISGFLLQSFHHALREKILAERFVQEFASVNLAAGLEIETQKQASKELIQLLALLVEPGSKGKLAIRNGFLPPGRDRGGDAMKLGTKLRASDSRLFF